ncbi:cytochrome c biogenesis protein ResA [Gordonia araii NBRC 100433]|uniref:Cytochrome c biogenesis protein ResA n=1 Tax=Gordonia araii NBRC 100433 TaxID=1073574 RepID=G7H1C7_9ACTN|nr:TlpA disulfide reductase family protein [Gordonia araii]NNG97840.1 TlpA family protein disulfide reductase [Gordonia araii NBRC 100433]GAB09652.1 cytochrome c biogenesis protein ResA [Gordonia araii NBRC 100433]
MAVRTRRRGRLAAILAGVVGVAVVAGCGTGKDAVRQGDTWQFVSPGGQTVITYEPSQRKPVAPLSGPELVTDKPVALTDFAGKVVVVNVWGSWCGPCRGEADLLLRTFHQTRDRGVAFLGINLRDHRPTARDFVADRGIDYPSIYDFSGAHLAALTTPTSVVPTTVILDRDHRPAVVYLRAVEAIELKEAVEKVLAEK